MGYTSDDIFIELEIVGLTRGFLLQEIYILILKEKSGNRLMPLIIEKSEFLRLKLALKHKGQSEVGLLLQLAQAYSIKLEHIILRAPKDGKTPASMFFVNETMEKRKIDTEASIAILTALECKAPILTYQSLFNRQLGEQKPGGHLSVPINVMSKQLITEALNMAVKEEKFELASLLRDELKIRDSFIASQNSDCENSEQLF
ncbi:MAG: bifunctional nuclease family protein [Bacteroidaceae bacterium]|nr:bifunctional nuclease family protein [Bacteroidaceae bacterium]